MASNRRILRGYAVILCALVCGATLAKDEVRGDDEQEGGVFPVRRTLQQHLESGAKPKAVPRAATKATRPAVVRRALDDLAERLGTGLDEIEVMGFEEVTWSDASLGCPERGKAYAQMVVKGSIIELAVAEQIFIYHAGEGRKPFLCEPDGSEETRLGEETEADAEAERADEEADESSEALRDPIIAKLFKRRVLISRPGFSIETHGKLQIQYYDADSDDPDSKDEFFIRRYRPILLGRIARSWTWKVEVEYSADVEAGSIDLKELDIRDVYLRYEGFKAEGRRLTLGNQKAPFSRDFLTPSAHQLLVERTFVGDTSLGVPDRALGIHFRGETRSGKVDYWASAGGLGHDTDANLLKFDTLVGNGDLNEGLLLSGRLDLHPRGAMTFSDGDPHTPGIKYTWSVAGYGWESYGGNNRSSDAGVTLDPERADLDSATGLEISGGLRGRGITLDWQYNRIRGETVAEDFTGGLYLGGVTHLDVAAVEGGYWIRGSSVELGGALSRLDADGYSETWDNSTLALNLHKRDKFYGKLQISHSWISSRHGIPGENFQETRVQVQYVW